MLLPPARCVLTFLSPPAHIWTNMCFPPCVELHSEYTRPPLPSPPPPFLFLSESQLSHRRAAVIKSCLTFWQREEGYSSITRTFYFNKQHEGPVAMGGESSVCFGNDSRLHAAEVCSYPAALSMRPKRSQGESYDRASALFNHPPPPTWVRHPSFGDQLRQQDAKRPHVRLDGELPVQRSLRGRPLDGELCACRRAEKREASVRK